jgi:protease-4
MPPDQLTDDRVLYGVAIVAAVLLGAVLAPFAWGATATAGGGGTVAVVELQGAISTQTTGAVEADLAEARRNDSIDAVVLAVNSPGGSVAASESLYLAVNRTAAEMPVVVSVEGAAASGGYMAALGGDVIYTTPSSMVGSVGVYGQLTPFLLSDVDGVVTTAPTKGTSGTPEEVRRTIERMKQRFVGLVMESRGDRLALDRTQVSRAKVYSGGVAVENGLADAIGGDAAAIAAAADRAGLEEYRVVRMENDPPTAGLTLAGYEHVETTRYLAMHGVPDRMVVSAAELRTGNATAGEVIVDG